MATPTPPPKKAVKKATRVVKKAPPSAEVRAAAWFPLVRDVGLFLGGVAGVAYETIGRNVERPTLLLLFAAMMGLPAFFPKGDKSG